ncbi:MAG: site-2 protease family protein [Candidatus Latescibacterota bacterium]|nr:MAG: site-2 protease family protein [Candidatus Latescibacterota bacterium]
MKNTLKLATYFGIPVKIHFTFPLILLAFGMEGWVRGGVVEALRGTLLVLFVFVCVVLHELGHSLQARRFGIGVRDIVLLPIGGVARAERIPENPWQEIAVAIAGPLVNFALATVFFVVVWIKGTGLDFEDGFFSSLLLINLVLGTFNLVPAFPMDGGRILRGLLATRMPYLRATRFAKDIGQLIALFFAVVGFLYTKLVMLPLIAVAIFYGAINEEKMIHARLRIRSTSVEDELADDRGSADEQSWR